MHELNEDSALAPRLSKRDVFRFFFVLGLAAYLTIMAALAHASAATGKMRIVVFGDSLTAGFMLAEEEAFPTVLEKALRNRGHDVEVVNASVSGDTASGGLARLDWALGDRADAVILELGANDMLRGVNPAKTYEALNQIIKKIKSKGVSVLLAGMVAAPGMGENFERSFNDIYPTLAKAHGISLYPFFLKDVAQVKSLNLADGLHPNAAGVEVLVRNILPSVENLIATRRAGR